MQKRTFYLATITLLLFGANFFILNTRSQTKPFTIGQILRAIASVNQATGNQKKILSDRILKDVRKRKVDFSLTKENEILLRNEGVTDELIEAIRQNSRSLPKPSPISVSTPISTPVPILTSTPKPAHTIYLESGDGFFDKFDFDQAIEQYTKVLELDPQNVHALIQRGYAYHYKGDFDKEDFDETLNDYNTAIKINPALIAEPNMICVRYEPSKNNADIAIANCSQAISAKPDFALFYYIRANAYRRNQDYNQAINDYTKASELYPNFYGAYLNRGLTYANKKSYEEAFLDVDKAISLHPNNLSAIIARGRLFGVTKDFDKAITEFNKVISLFPNKSIGYYYRGLTYVGKEVLDPTMIEFNEAIDIDPFDNSYYGRAYSYYRKSKNDQALLDYTKAIELEPKFADAYFQRGFFYYSKKDYDRAILEFTKAIELKTGLTSVYLFRGSCYFFKKDFDHALSDYNKAIEINPQNYSLYRNRAGFHEKLGQKDLALADRKKADELKKSVVTCSLEGLVSFKDKKDFALAEVKLTLISGNGSSITTHSNLRRFFSVGGLLPGKYRVEISAFGYKTFTTEFLLKAGVTKLSVGLSSVK